MDTKPMMIKMILKYQTKCHMFTYNQYNLNMYSYEELCDIFYKLRNMAKKIKNEPEPYSYKSYFPKNYYGLQLPEV